MRYSSVNHWYKVQQALDGLENTSSLEVQQELLRHLSSSHIKKLRADGGTVSAEYVGGEAATWCFRNSDAANSFCLTVREWFTAQKVRVPTR